MKMLPSSATPHQELLPSLESAYLYALVSRDDPGVFKLGITTQPAARFDALTKRFGRFDLQESMLVLTANRRAALDLEGILQAVFWAPAWRVDPPLPAAKQARPQRSNGDSEWYRMEAFELMGRFINGMIQHDGQCALHRFAMVENIQDSALWQEHLRHAGTQTRFHPVRDVEQEARQSLARNEANFAALQEWMQQRQHLLVSATPLASDEQGNRRWTFVYRAKAAEAGHALDETNDDGEWQALASACVVSHHTGRSSRSFTYLGGLTSVITPTASTHTVEFLLTPTFTQASIEHPPLRDLLAQIVGWLEAASRQQD